MLKRPTSRRKSHAEGIEINLVPILDTMVTLIGFLLFTTSFLAIVSIETLFPQGSPEEIQNKIQEKPLQLTLTIGDKDVKIWSPFEKIPQKSVPHTPEGQPDIKGIHETLLDIKKKFPTEQAVVLIPTKTTAYDNLISIMDTARSLEPSDPPLYLKNESTGNDEVIKTLFPKVVFGNLLEEG